VQPQWVERRLQVSKQALVVNSMQQPVVLGSMA
jgi:hypothetical protein